MSQLDRRTPFRMEERFGDGRALRLVLIGELDVAVVKQLTDRLSELKKGAYTVSLDLARLQFVDSSGLRELITEIAHARRAGWPLRIHRQLTEPVSRVIDLVGARSFFWPDER